MFLRTNYFNKKFLSSNTLFWGRMKIDVISRMREVFDWEVSPRDISSHLLKHSLFAVTVISVASAYGNYYLNLGNELS
ncbi:MAG TPA: hypothetical protein VKY45_12040, partial [Marinilabiliaceae bacterium]|nr:hypothetical protein [Marinilabiliaceae bacterium]